MGAIMYICIVFSFSPYLLLYTDIQELSLRNFATSLIYSADDGHISCDFNDDEGCKLFQDESLFRWEPSLDSDGMCIQ